MWLEAVTEGAGRFIAAWGKGEVDAARVRQKREEKRLRKL